MEFLFFIIGFLLGSLGGVTAMCLCRSTVSERRRAMGKRNIEIKVRLNRKEAELLNKHVKKSRLSREAYLRHLINGLVPQDAPPPAYFDFMRELHSIGNNLNQIAQKAHVLGVMDERRYDEALQRFDQLIRDITKAVILPKPMDMEGPREACFVGRRSTREAVSLLTLAAKRQAERGVTWLPRLSGG